MDESEVSHEIAPEAKQNALDQVLASQTFNRCVQLKRILRYVCSMDLEGRQEDITEYLIGVEALGRGSDFSATGDSAVRSQVHALRKKLQEYYLVEAPHAEVRIEFPKGCYSPRYLRVQPTAGGSAPPTGDEQVRPSRHGNSVAWLAFAVGVLGTMALGYGFWQPLAKTVTRAKIPAVIKEAWGPLLGDEEALVVVAAPAQLFLRDYGGLSRPSDPVWMGQIDQIPEVLDFYRHYQPVSPSTKLSYLPNANSPLWGDAAAAMSAVSTLADYRVSSRVLPEWLCQPYLLRDRNVLLFGRPEYSATARLLLEKTPFGIEYNSEMRSWVVRNRSPKPGEPPVYQAQGDSPELYGLLTVIPSEIAGSDRKQTVIFSGLTTGGTMAAQEFFSKSESLNQLQARFRQDGLKRWPRGWQVVLAVKVTTKVYEGNLPMTFSYKTHRVFER
jgi:hypothetical protein